jgi:hypothetical protein
VLIDRAGNLIGKYRKVYLPREEIEGGLSPGSDYPVFRTDFGKVGLYDLLRCAICRSSAGFGAPWRRDDPDADLGWQSDAG